MTVRFALRSDLISKQRNIVPCVKHYEDFIEKLKSFDLPLHEKFIDIMDEQLAAPSLNLPGHSLTAFVWVKE